MKSKGQRHHVKGDVLVVDVGNTSTSLGLYTCGRDVERVARLPTRGSTDSAIRGKIRACAGSRRIAGCVLASVVPKTTSLWVRAVRRQCGVRPIRVRHGLNLGVALTYPRPGTIGADRLANACGAAARYGTPVIVADFGTALTFDVVLPVKGYVGGIIVPGLPLMFDYLAERTALLPRLAPGPTRNPVGKSTAEAIRLGAKWGYGGMVREVTARLQRALGLDRVRLVATGGYAGWVMGGLKMRYTVDANLTLYGLGRIYELNRGR